MKKGGSESGTWIGYEQIRGVKAGWEEVRGARANIGDPMVLRTCTFCRNTFE